MKESEQIHCLQMELESLREECEMWKKTSSQLTQTINRLVSAYVVKTDKA